jgi:hypothetical protein
VITARPESRSDFVGKIVPEDVTLLLDLERSFFSPYLTIISIAAPESPFLAKRMSVKAHPQIWGVTGEPPAWEKIGCAH